MTPQRLPTEVLRVDPERPDVETIGRAAAVVRRGGLVAFPTETVYGLGANALDAAAVGRVFSVKQRPSVNPLIVHVHDAEAARRLVTLWPPAADKLSRTFWPGPLTLVLPKTPAIPQIVTAGSATVAVRVPDHPVALALLRAANVPLVGPSANRSSRLSPTRAEHVLRSLSGLIEVVLDAGPTGRGLESTVLDLTGGSPTILRPGPIGPAEIEEVIGPVHIRREDSATRAGPMPSPGMLPRHYAPRVPLECAAGDGSERVAALLAQGVRVGWLALRAVAGPQAGPPQLVRIDMPEDPERYASQLYASLHTLEEAGVERIVVALPPQGEAWLAVHDRLRRASAST